MRCFEQRALTRKKMQEHILVLPLKIVTDCTKWTTTMGAERMREKKTEQRECVFAFSGFSLVLTKEIIDHKNRIDDCLSVFFLSLFILSSPFFRVLLLVHTTQMERIWRAFPCDKRRISRRRRCCCCWCWCKRRRNCTSSRDRTNSVTIAYTSLNDSYRDKY